MDEQRVQTYFNLIDQLLNCPDGEEIKIIEANKTLIDAGLIEMMNQIAAKLIKQGNNNGKWLQNFSIKIAYSAYNLSLPDAKYFDFIIEAQKRIVDGFSQSQIYRFFEENLDAIDDELANALQIWANRSILDMESEDKHVAGCAMYAFAHSIEHSPLENQRSKLEIALTGYNIVLKMFTRVDEPLNWARTYFSLGDLYKDRVEGDKQENIEQAIAAYNNALKVFTKVDYPQKYIDINIILGNIYREREVGIAEKNIEFSINAYTAALEILDSDSHPEDWSGVQYNLGNAYRDRIIGDNKDNIEIAIKCFLAALKVEAKINSPQIWAATQYNLALSYQERMVGVKKENIELTINHFQAALKVYTKEDFPIDWALTQYNLGNAYKNRIKGGKAKNLERAILAYERSFKIW